MSIKTAYTFSVLRYVHDPLSQEFANVGVVLYSPRAKYIGVLCSKKYGRLSKMFLTVPGGHYRSTVTYIEAVIAEEGERLLHALPFGDAPKSIDEVLLKVLPKDDSSFVFSSVGSGLSDNPERTLEDLYRTYVERYDGKTEKTSRSDDDVWRIFKRPLEEKQVMAYLKPHKVVGKHYEHEFDYSWKNQVWHSLEAVSFDLMEGDSIVDKANIWLGRAQSLSDSAEKFKLYLLLGRPNNPKLLKKYQQAENILNKIDVPHEFIKEDGAADFAEDLKKKIVAHG